MSGEPVNCQPAVLRDMVESDLDPITAMDARLFGVDCWPKTMFAAELAQPQTRRYIVAEVPAPDMPGGAMTTASMKTGTMKPAPMKTVGYAGLMCLPPTGDIQTIGVLPEFEGRGIARAMMDELLAEAARRGAREVLLEVSAVNPRAQELYRRYGFEHIHTRRRYYRDGSDGLIMRLTLPAPQGASAPDQSRDRQDTAPKNTAPQSDIVKEQP